MKSFSSTCAVSLVNAVKHGRVRSLLLFGLLVVGLSLCASAQTATVVGTITDPSGSVVPNVTVTATHVETGQVQNRQGQRCWPVSFCRSSTRPLQHQGRGFGIRRRPEKRRRTERWRPRPHRLRSEDGRSQRDHYGGSRCRPGATESGEVSYVITGQQVTQLATNGRSMYSLANLTPGASSGQADFQTPTRSAATPP